MKTRLTKTRRRAIDRFVVVAGLPFRSLWALALLAGLFARYWLDPHFRREVDLECALEAEGEDGPTVARILAEGAGA
jgi:hypothetical protein